MAANKGIGVLYVMGTIIVISTAVIILTSVGYEDLYWLCQRVKKAGHFG